ncbi:MAG: alanine--tRNA ligase [Verrucomicrobiae bacterium]|nr:alanine--tRNA ligase [Verrucomicrobiae bacterium]
MTSREIRQSFLDFFREQQHAIVPSASLLPQSPGLLFTNAGMNPFVPIFLGVEKSPYDPPRAADTQKCIRAGGKHNDLEDVGYDTYHHTFFEMLGNWSFGNYFKKEAIQWAWELVVRRWGLPPQRLYASVYAPKPGDPGEFDQEAWDLWAALFRESGCDPEVQIVHGSVKDNFWMMGETGPCGPCSELHVDLTPEGDSAGKLVNNDSDLCIEIWNLVFIQYNAEADGSFRELPAKHVDTGMGFERACSIIQNTKGFTDFSRKPSNYATDVFTPLFDKLSELSGKTFLDIYPDPGADRRAFSEDMKTAIAFRVIADHLRTLAFSIADGILPGTNGRNYVLRRILRRAVRYGRQLGFSGLRPFFGALVETLVREMGDVFPELRERQESIRTTLEREEAAFNETLDRGLRRFEDAVVEVKDGQLSGDVTFELYDTFGFPDDLTRLLCSERGIAVDETRFTTLMEQQKERARAAQKTSVVRALDLATDVSTVFCGFDHDSCEAAILEIHPQDDSTFLITDRTPFYAEMGGQVGDTGTLVADGREIPVLGVQQIGNARAHIVPTGALAGLKVAIQPGDTVTLRLDTTRRRPIEAHHSATHLLHWALHEEVSADIAQQGSSVDEHRLRFDFNSGALTPAQIGALEDRVNTSVQRGDAVSWREVRHADIKGRADIMQFFGDKYGEFVRVVQIGGHQGQLDGYSMELCAGTHVRQTGDIGWFAIRSEGAIAAGVRRIEAVCGQAARSHFADSVAALGAEISALGDKLGALNTALAAAEESPLPAPVPPTRTDLQGVSSAKEAKTLLSQLTAHRDALQAALLEGGKKLNKAHSIQNARAVAQWLDESLAGVPSGAPLIARIPGDDPALLQEALNAVKSRQFPGVAVLTLVGGDSVHIGVIVPAALTARFQAGKLVQELTALVGGKGGGKPDMARGAGKEVAKAGSVLEKAQELLA